MKLGLYGGTFNPIHYGHLINAEIIMDDFSLDKIVFIPSKIPVHKDLACMISADDRLNMLKLAVEDKNGFDISRIEIDRDAPSYTILTVQEFYTLYPESELFLIIGSDSYNEITTWKEFDKILAIISIIVLKRPGEMDYQADIIKKAKSILFAENPLIEISSSCIRNRLQKNKSVNYLLPDKVIDYINKKGLYKN